MIIAIGLIAGIFAFVMLSLIKKDLQDSVIKDICSSTTIFALLIYGSFCYLAVRGKISTEVITNVVFTLLAFYYGTKKSGNSNGGDTK
jgi:hypothetical protein